MGTVRKLAAVLACAATLSIVGASTAGAARPSNCERLAKLTARVEQREARIAARNADRPRAASAAQQHKPNPQNRLQEKIADLEARCSD